MDLTADTCYRRRPVKIKEAAPSATDHSLPIGPHAMTHQTASPVVVPRIAIPNQSDCEITTSGSFG